MALAAPSVLLVVSQLSFALARPIAGQHQNGIHFDRPYPAVNSREAKAEFSWNIDDVLREAAACDGIAVRVPNEWLRRYLAVVFTSLEWPLSSADRAECVIGVGEKGHSGRARLVVHRVRQ